MKSSGSVASKVRISKDTNASIQKSVSEVRNELDANEDVFAQVFKAHCMEYDTQLLPHVKVVSQRELLHTFSFSTLTSNPLTSETDKSDKEVPTELLIVQSGANRILQIVFKHFTVNKQMLSALKSTFETFNTVSILKLEFCHLGAKEIQFLRHLLKHNPTITELSLNGNPNANQNHGTVLKGTALNSLSLRFCKIDSKGLEILSNELSSECTLMHLNLSSNFIGDEGIGVLNKALRVNRQLSCLNLADNQIGNEGCVELMGVFMKFALSLDEIFIRRQIIVAHILKGFRMQDADLSGAGSLDEQTENIQKKKSNSSKSQFSKKQPQSKTTVTKFDDVDYDLHPFVRDSYLDNKEIICKGNFHLISLNLACNNSALQKRTFSLFFTFLDNKITSIGLKKICEVLNYQSEMNGLYGKGLGRLVLDGNNVRIDSPEMYEITQCLSSNERNSEKVMCVDTHRNHKRIVYAFGFKFRAKTLPTNKCLLQMPATEQCLFRYARSKQIFQKFIPR